MCRETVSARANQNVTELDCELVPRGQRENLQRGMEEVRAQHFCHSDDKLPGSLHILQDPQQVVLVMFESVRALTRFCITRARNCGRQKLSQYVSNDSRETDFSRSQHEGDTKLLICWSDVYLHLSSGHVLHQSEYLPR
jgi:hypothetical protein